MYPYEIIYDVGGGVYLKALVGLDDQGEVIYKFTGSSQPLPKDVVESFLSLTDFAKAEFTKHAGLKQITIKPYEEI